MRASLRADIVRKNMPAQHPSLGGVGSLAQGKIVDAKDGEHRPTQADARGGALRGSRRQVGVGPIGHRVTELIGGGGRENADQGENPGIGPVRVHIPVGG